MTRASRLAAAMIGAAAITAAQGAGSARADDGAALLGQAQKAIDDVDYDAAHALTDQALASGTLARADLARAHLLAGEVAATLGDDAGAHDHFERFLLLAPDGVLPPGQSPKITQPFAAARASADALGKASFDVTVAREPGKVVFSVDGDPLHMVVRVHVHMNHGSDAEEVGARIEVPLEDRVDADATITLLDDHGNQLAEHSTHIDAMAAPTPAHVTETEHSLPAAVRWPTWAALTVIAGGACGYFSYRTGKDQDELAALNSSSSMHTFDEAKAIDDRGKRDALLTNVTLGVAAAALAATAITFFVDDTHVVEVQPMAAPGTAGASATFRF